MQTCTEQRFEDHIEQHLNQSRYRSLQSTDHDKSLCLVPNETLQFIDALNDAHQTDFTMEDKVDIENVYQKVRQHEELRQVIEADNSESNIKRKFNDVIDEILLDFVNSKLDLFTKLSQPEVKADLKHQLYRAYLNQPSPSVRRSG